MTASASPEVIEKWRSEAEKFYGDEYCIDRNTDPDQDSYYADQFLDLKVNAFIDGRQSAVIELPKAENHDLYITDCDDFGVGIKCGLHTARKAIEAQGYQVNFNQPTQC